jgi:opacity protein-like surface antigen
MRKCLFVFSLLILLAGLSQAADIRIEAKASYFQPSEADFRNIYGSGFQYGGELDIGLPGGLELWVAGSYFSKTGETTFTEEKIRLKIIPLGGGVKYGVMIGSFNLYAGLGLYYNQYKETDILGGGDITKNKIGYVGKLGSILDLTKRLLLDFCLEYSTCKIQPADFSFDIGGLSFGAGLGYEF